MISKTLNDKDNQSKIVREILLNTIHSQLEELPDSYDISQDVIDSLNLSLYITHSDRVVWKGGKTKFTKVFEKEVRKLVDDNILNFEEMGLLTYIASTYTGYEDNLLKINGEYATKKMIVEDLHNKTKNLQRSSIKHYERVLSDLENKKIICSIPNPNNKRSKIFYISPHIFYKGQYIDKTVKDAIVDKLEDFSIYPNEKTSS